MILKMKLDNNNSVVYVDDSLSEKGAFDMWTIKLPDGTTFFPSTTVEALRIFELHFGTGVTIRYEKENNKKMA